MAIRKREAIALAQGVLSVATDGVWGPVTDAAYRSSGPAVKAIVAEHLAKANVNVDQILTYQRNDGGAKKAVFNDRVIPAVRSLAKANGLNGDLMIAQMRLETGGGARTPPGSNNFSGIKWVARYHAGKYESTGKAGTKEFVNGKEVAIKDTFIKFPSPEAYAKYFVETLGKSKRYAAAYQESDARKGASMLASAGYATDPKYAAKLSSLLA